MHSTGSSLNLQVKTVNSLCSLDLYHVFQWFLLVNVVDKGSIVRITIRFRFVNQEMPLTQLIMSIGWLAPSNTGLNQFCNLKFLPIRSAFISRTTYSVDLLKVFPFAILIFYAFSILPFVNKFPRFWRKNFLLNLHGLSTRNIQQIPKSVLVFSLFVDGFQSFIRMEKISERFGGSCTSGAVIFGNNVAANSDWQHPFGAFYFYSGWFSVQPAIFLS